jgi:hypothetical protein
MDLDGIREVRLLRKQITWGTWRMVQVEPGEAERRSSCNRRMTAEELETISGTESRTASESLGESCCTGELLHGRAHHYEGVYSYRPPRYAQQDLWLGLQPPSWQRS